MNTNFFCFILLLNFLFPSITLNAQSNLDNGWAAFCKNDRKEARKYFILAANENDSKAEANLALIFIDETDGKDDDAFRDFQNFASVSSNSHPYLFALWNSPGVFGYKNKLKESQLNFIKALLNDPKANGTLKAIAHSSLGKHYEATNNVKKANEEFEKIGTIADWALTGEFENISESGFDKNYEPVNQPDENTTFEDKNGAKVKWFKMKGNRADKWVDLTYHFFADNSIIYAQSFVYSPVDQQLQLRIGTSGSLKAWVNDLLVYSESKERNNDVDTYITVVKLNKGDNRLLLQIGSSEINRSNFMVRFTDEDGNPVQGLTASSVKQDYKKENESIGKNIKIFAEEYFENKISESPEKIINYLLLASTYLKNDKAYEARKVLLEAQKKAPECSYIKTKLIEAYQRENDETDVKISLEWLKEHDGESLISLNLFYNEEEKKENYEEAKRILDKIELLYGVNEDTDLKRANLLANMNERDKMLAWIEKSYNKYSDSYSFVDFKSSVEQNINKNVNASISVMKKYLKDNYSNTAQQKLSDAYFAKGDIANGITAYTEQLKHDPYDCSIPYKLANYYYKVRNYEEAERMYHEAISLAPYAGHYWGSLAGCYADMGKKQDAVNAYKRAIELNPFDYESRKDLRKLMGKPEVFTYFSEPDVYDMYKKSPAASAYPENNSVILLNEVQRVVYNGGASESKYEVLIKIFNQQGIDLWKEYQVSVNSMENYFIEKAEVVKANGNKVKAETDKSHIVFTSLEEGDAIHVTYKIRSFTTAKLAPNFWDSFYFNLWYPCQYAKYSLLIAPDVKFRYKCSKEEVKPEIKKEDEFDFYSWKAVDQPAVPEEKGMPVISDIANVSYISSFSDWESISSWYNDLAFAKSKADFEVKEVVHSLLENKNNLSELEKAKIIYNYVVTNIRYSSVPFLQSELIPQKASKVINTKIGDCKDVSTLFVAMCREAGLKSDLVLVNTRDRGYSLNILPSVEFNHCIARLEAEGKYYFIELTSDFLPFNTFHSGLYKAEALVINSKNQNGATELINLDPETGNRNKIIRKTTVTIEGNELQIMNHNYKTAMRAAELRGGFRDFGEKEQKKRMQEAISYYHSNAELTSLDFKNLKSLDDTLDYTIGFKLTDGINDVGEMKLLNIPWGDKSDSKLFSFSDDRTFPVDLWNKPGGDSETETMTIKIPSTLRLAEIPKQVTFTCPIADYSLTCKAEPGKLIMTRNFIYKKDFIETTEVKAFNDFYKKVISADSKPIAFK